MKIFQKINVFEAAQQRVSYLFDEFENVVVGISGGKDSTIVFNLALMEAKKRNRLPLSVLWLDQEAEFQMTADYVKTIMEMPEVKPLWLQVHFKIFNATSHEEEWLNCWEPGKEWMREKDPIAIMATVKTIKDLLQKRLSNKVDLLNTLQSTSLDNVPDAIQKMREEEASRVRAVMQEQKDLIEIINALFPNE
ncbi:phosphoadenosine phosphosulfate reductase family protein [Flavobacterium sp.]|uniref:phosphoadenosine phosphosulfate reductase domain-containing protein n=1 Tax=Flavobacterium sp. TaxID=239 RepID=UPI0025C1862C|nr:phosphoadenosine phosphosulfate reductase family protein [Flavobacterium sp.]MBA4155064.1 hypothetical protein [Flavobacterium sp.]